MLHWIATLRFASVVRAGGALSPRCQGWQHLAGGTANDELLGALSPRCHRDTAGTLYGFDRSSGPAIDRQGADLPTYRPTYRQTHILRAYLPWRRIASLRTEPRARKRDTLGCPLIGTACHGGLVHGHHEVGNDSPQVGEDNERHHRARECPHDPAQDPHDLLMLKRTLDRP